MLLCVSVQKICSLFWILLLLVLARFPGPAQEVLRIPSVTEWTLLSRAL